MERKGSLWFKVLILLCFFSLHLSAGIAQNKDDLSLRLPGDLVPSHYLVRLQPFINGNLSINGHVEITFEVKNATERVILHIMDIITKNDTTRVAPIDNLEATVPIVKQENDKERQFYIATLKDKLEKGKSYVLSMDFEGYLNDKMLGFYRSSYVNGKGETIMIAATHFEPTDARRAFPCFDEPAFKAKFAIEIAREEGMRAISNMPRYDFIPIKGQDGWFCDRFNTTFPMSTYLVAVVISDFAHLESNYTKDYGFRVWARNNVISTAEYAIKIGPPLSKFFENFFNVSFPLPKQDMVAVPDFSAGGMENWGLITYRESALLYDPKVASAQAKMRTASVISHELAHMWFGDLVSPAWWTDIWLNEGFATYMEYLGLLDQLVQIRQVADSADNVQFLLLRNLKCQLVFLKVEPSMRPLDQFVMNEIHDAFKMDSLASSHPISIPVQNPAEINEIFDSISYSKGGAIIRMMSSFLTEESFRKGLTNYLKNLSYSNAEQDDLWRYLTKQAHQDGNLDNDITVKEVMDTWTLQMGYPVVTVARNLDGTATLSQERFLLSSKNDTTTVRNSSKWWIPITFTTQDSPNFNISKPKVWMMPTEVVKTVTGLPKSKDSWVILNLAQAGFYRVNYDKENWDAMIVQLLNDNTIISDINKAQIIDDAFNLARAGLVDYRTALRLITYVKYEKEFVPIRVAFDSLDFVKDMFTYTGEYGLLKNFLLSLVLPLYDTIDFVDNLNDPHIEQRKRTEIVKWACELGHQPCIDAALELYSKWMKNPADATIISPNLKPVVYCTAIKEGGEEEWSFAWARYMNTSIATEEKELLEAMCCSRSVWILSEFLNRTLTSGKGIKKQMVGYILPTIAKTDVGRYVAWQLIRSKWSDIIDYIGTVSFTLGKIIEAATGNLNTELQLEELRTFKSDNAGNFASATRAMDQAVESVHNNINWMNNYYGTIIQYLKDNNYDNSI